MAVTSASVTVGTTATLLSTPGSTTNDQKIVVIKNDSGSTVFLGGADVTTANGFPLATASSLSLNLGPGDALYGRVASSTAAVTVLRTRS